jgi:4-carboxymuconolactone decarboxylase
MTRATNLSYAEMDPEQQQVHDSIANGPRGSVGGPFNVLLRSPALCQRVQELGLFIRFGSSLPGHLRELAILVSAHHWRAHYEWYAHSRIARAEGLDDAVIEAIRVGDDAPFEDRALQAIREFATSLLATGRVSDEVHDAATAVLGERGVVELVGTIGYYCLVSFTLNAFEVPAPAGGSPLPDR